MRSRVNGRWSGFIVGGAAALTLAACAPLAGSSAGSELPATSTIASTVASDQLRNRLSGTSLRGGNAAGEAFCTYYDPDGTMTTVIPGYPAEAGRWTVRDGRVCETMRGLTSCSRFDFQPPADQSVTIASLEGAFLPYTASVNGSDTCGGGA